MVVVVGVEVRVEWAGWVVVVVVVVVVVSESDGGE